MSSPFTHIGVNILGWSIGWMLHLIFNIFPDWATWPTFFWFVMGGEIFDLDHLLYFGTTTHPSTIQNIKIRMEKDYQAQNPHPFVCHAIEFLGIFGGIGYLLANNIMIVLIWGWALHMMTDSASYIRRYRSWSPWLPYFSYISWFILVRD